MDTLRRNGPWRNADACVVATLPDRGNLRVARRHRRRQPADLLRRTRRPAAGCSSRPHRPTGSASFDINDVARAPSPPRYRAAPEASSTSCTPTSTPRSANGKNSKLLRRNVIRYSTASPLSQPAPRPRPKVLRTSRRADFPPTSSTPASAPVTAEPAATAPSPGPVAHLAFMERVRAVEARAATMAYRQAYYSRQPGWISMLGTDHGSPGPWGRSYAWVRKVTGPSGPRSFVALASGIGMVPRCRSRVGVSLRVLRWGQGVLGDASRRS